MPSIRKIAEADDAICISGAGHPDANGLYVAIGATWHDAPAYENDKKCFLSREPHNNSKTGKTTYGWIIGKDRKPLYAVESESKTPPTSGWRRFAGAAPAPSLMEEQSVGEAALACAQSWKDHGNALFAAKRYEEAEEQWTRALSLGDCLKDEAMQVALLANRAEVRLRLRSWDAALRDAQAALVKRPSHDKALLRAAVAARELKRYDEAREYVLRCLDACPTKPEARQLKEDIEDLQEAEHQAQCEGARQKLAGALVRDEAGLDRLPKAFGAKDMNSKKGFRAFAGYGDTRSSAAPRPDVSDLPHHRLGLTDGQVAAMDHFFQDLRNKSDFKIKQVADAKTNYEQMKLDYKSRAQDDLQAGKLQAIDSIMPSLKDKLPEHDVVEVKAGPKARRPDVAARGEEDSAELSKAEVDEIDKLFRPFTNRRVSPGGADEDLVKKAAERRERLATAKKDHAENSVVEGAGASGSKQKPAATKSGDSALIGALQQLASKNKGEPTRFQQTDSEVFGFWKVPREITKKDVKVSCTGTNLSLEIKGVTVFDRKLFDAVKGRDADVSVEKGEVGVTLTKTKKNTKWTQLGAR